MKIEKLKYFKGLLIKEQKRVYKLLNQMKENQVINSNAEMANELSSYDNHPGDLATELFDKEKGLALKKNEISILNKIDKALKRIDTGEYGNCSACKKEIPEERLKFLPYADYCVDCQKDVNVLPEEKNNRPVEETILEPLFGYGGNNSKQNVEFDAEDSYQSVSRFNRLEGAYEDYLGDEEDGYVEPIEKISNEQYRSQLPD